MPSPGERRMPVTCRSKNLPNEAVLVRAPVLHERMEATPPRRQAEPKPPGASFDHLIWGPASRERPWRCPLGAIVHRTAGGGWFATTAARCPTARADSGPHRGWREVAFWHETVVCPRCHSGLLLGGYRKRRSSVHRSAVDPNRTSGSAVLQGGPC